MNAFVPFPSIPHLEASASAVRTDRILSAAAREELLSAPVVVEEKIDGENLGLSLVDGQLRAQARGDYVELGGRHFRGLDAWLRPRHDRLSEALAGDLMVFGEWCADVHSVRYDRLPDWLIVFDVYDRVEGSFWSAARRDELAGDLGLATAPRLFRGRVEHDVLRHLIGRSAFGDAPMEGIVLRQEDDDWTVRRAKRVRDAFTQGISEHWRRGPRRRNRLAIAA